MQSRGLGVWIGVFGCVWALLHPAAGAANFDVTNNKDTGTGSFRAAITSVNSQLPSMITHTITFTSTLTITPLSELPAISARVSISGNGSTIKGTSAGAGADGLVLSGPGQTVTALNISGFADSGIRITGSSTTVTQCKIGKYDRDSSGNGAHGIYVESTASNVTIGLAVMGGGNVISGNGGHGIALANTESVTIQNNIIGLAADGLATQPNANNGVYAANTDGVTIGGTTRNSGNTISGNTMNGILLGFSSGSILGNRIGLNSSGASAGNGWNGVSVYNPSAAVTIGGASSAARNTISGNGQAGILGEGDAAFQVAVLGNRIGTNVGGTAAIGNGGDGIELRDSGNYTIGDAVSGGMNIISGNDGNGVRIHQDNLSTILSNNRIGTNAEGTAAVPNQGDGVRIEQAASVAFGGGAGFENLLSGNGGNGIHSVAGSTAGGALVIKSCRVGVDAAGTAAIPNGLDGIRLARNSTGCTVGDTTGAPSVVASGNGGNGLVISDTGCTLVAATYAGVGADGATVLPNGDSGLVAGGIPDIDIGATGTGGGNIFSGNTTHGAVVYNCAAVALINSKFGVDAGDAAAGNGVDGMAMSACANVAIGGAAAKACTFAGNGARGVSLDGGASGSMSVVASHNRFGLPGAGNGSAGVLVMKSGMVKLPASFTVVMQENVNTGNQTGVTVDASAAGTTDVYLEGDKIYGNEGKGISLGTNVHMGVTPPVITQFLPYITGTAPANSRVRLFVDSDDEGETAADTVVANADGVFFSTANLAAHAGKHLTAHATVANARTSEFSAPVLIHQQLAETTISKIVSRINQAIPDPTTGFTHTIISDSPGTIQDLDVVLGLTHSWVGQLTVKLRHDDTGTEVVLLDNPGSPALGSKGCDKDDYNIILDDEGTGGAIHDLCGEDMSSPPNYTPNEALSAFDGELIAGSWTLTIVDFTPGNTGMLNVWGITANNMVSTPVVFVDKRRGGPRENGRSWAYAFDNLQEGVDAAAAINAEVWVAGGVYDEERVDTALGENTGAVVLREYARLYACFAGNELLRDQREPIFNPTTIDGSAARGGQPATHVVRAQGLKSALLDGFTITGGLNAGNGGAGLLAENVDELSLAGCTFTGNQSGLGAAARITGGSADLLYCTFEDNTADEGLSALNTKNTLITIRESAFRNNIGGAAYIDLAPGTATPTATLLQCYFSENSIPTFSGGALRLGANDGEGLARIERCWFGNNSAGFEGGAFYAHYSVYSELVNCVFDGNTAANFGNAVATRGTALLNSCTLNRNNGAAFYSVCELTGGNVALFNSILWSEDESQLPLLEGDDFFSLVRGVDDPYMHGMDPLFVDSSNGNLALQNASPCRDLPVTRTWSWALGAVSVPDNDFQGTLRPQQAAMDVGAFEMAYSGTCGGGATYSQANTPDTITAGHGTPTAAGSVEVRRNFNLRTEFGTAQPVVIRCVRVPLRQAVTGQFVVHVTLSGGGSAFHAYKYVNAPLSNNVLEIPVQKYFKNQMGEVLTVSASVEVDGEAGQIFEFGGNNLGETVPGWYRDDTGWVQFGPAFNLGLYVKGDIRDCLVEDYEAPVVTLDGATPETIECGTAWIDPGATAEDDCDGEVDVTVEGAEGLGETTGGFFVNYTARDNAGNSTSVSRQVFVEDTTAPQITLNGGAAVSVECGTVWSDPGAIVEDACDGALTPQIIGTVNTAAKGDYTLMYEAEDAAGNLASVKRTVTVTDTQPPVVVLNGGADITLECGAAWTDPGATATDACEGARSVTVTGAVDLHEPGVYNLLYTASDSALRQGSASRKVTVQDTQAPVVTLNGAAALTLECGAAWTDPGATANDACDGTLAVTVTGAVNRSTPGAYTLTYSAEDAGNRTGSVTRTVTVADTASPVVAINGSSAVSLECGAVWTDPGATANDACDGALSVSVVGTVNTASPGAYPLIYRATDRAGRIGEATRTVTVADTLAPVVTLNGQAAVNIACSATWSDPGAAASDACEGAKTPTVTGTVSNGVPGTYTLTYTAKDSGNRTGSAVRTVTVLPCGTPTIALNGAASVQLECGDAWSDPGAVALDAGGAPLTVTVTGTVNRFLPGVYTLTYKATPPGAAQISVTRTVTVADTLNPVVSLNGPAEVLLECGDAWSDAGATADDACDGALAVAVSGSVDPSEPGVHTLTYTATDGGGRTGSAVRVVEVADTEPPLITLNGPASLTIACDGVYTEQGAAVDDTCDAAAAVDVEGGVNTTVSGVYEITYTGRDAAGNTSAPLTRTVTVQACGTARIGLIGPAAVQQECGEIWNDPGATANNADGSPLAVSVEGAVDPSDPGAYTLTYRATPSGGAPLSVTRTVTVADTQPPVVTLNGAAEVTLNCGTDWTDPHAAGMDACAGALAVSRTGALNTGAPGTYTLTYTATDGVRSDAATRTVIVRDNCGGPSEVTVPAVTGMTQGNAENAITSVGLAVGGVAEQYHASVEAGRVISQSPASGTNVPSGSAVSLVVSLGQEPAGDITVPNVAGLTQAAAESAVTTLTLSVGTVTQQYHPTVPAGRVVSQSPLAGAKVAAGTAVALVISLGPEPAKVQVPSLNGLARAAAETAIVNAGLVVGAVSEQHHATVPLGGVISQNPAAGTLVNPGSSVALVVSLGPPTGNVAVPALTGMTRTAAEAAIVNAGLAVGAVTEQNHATVPAGRIISQNPAAGTSVAPGSSVALVVSLGPAPANATVPTLAGMTRAAAEAAIVNAGLVVGTVTEQRHATIPAGSVISQNPAAGTSVARGSSVAMVVSLGPVSVPDIGNTTREAAEAAIAAAGLTLGGVTEAYSDTVPAGWVISQNPAAGAGVAPGSAVALVVSKGPQPVTVPDLSGMTREDAEAALTAAGLAVGTITEAFSEEVGAGFILTQDPVGGASVAPGTAVSLTVSLGPEDTGCGCGCKKSDFSPEGLKKHLGDLFLAGLALGMLAAVSQRRGGM